MEYKGFYYLMKNKRIDAFIERLKKTSGDWYWSWEYTLVGECLCIRRKDDNHCPIEAVAKDCFGIKEPNAYSNAKSIGLFRWDAGRIICAADSGALCNSLRQRILEAIGLEENQYSRSKKKTQETLR